MLKGFREFILRGNVVDLAVAVIIGAAFGAIVTSLVEDVITPFISTILPMPDFSTLQIGDIKIGNFLNAVLSFLLIAAAVYVLIVVPMNRLRPPSTPTVPARRTCPECLSDIPAEARRCAFCTAPLTPQAPPTARA